MSMGRFMSPMEFRIGAVVQLKSGGPMMTITSIEADSQAACTTWFDGTRKETGTFPLETLRVQEQRPPSRQGRAFFQKPPQ
jgi:uncharacterized protein YodC (DUF2158 family)